MRHRRRQHRADLDRGRAVRRSEGVGSRPRGLEVRPGRLHRTQVRLHRRRLMPTARMLAGLLATLSILATGAAGARAALDRDAQVAGEYPPSLDLSAYVPPAGASPHTPPFNGPPPPS